MSDDDFDGDVDYDNLDYSEGSDSEENVDLENQYYTSKGLRSEDLPGALASFQRVVDLEDGNKGEWGFKAVKQMLKILFKLEKYEEMKTNLKLLLSYAQSVVTKNQVEKSVNSILTYVGESKNKEIVDFVHHEILDWTKVHNDRLWFKISLKLGKIYVEREEYDRLTKVLNELRDSCKTPEGEDDSKKGTQLLEIYALEIQMYTAQKNNKKLKRIYEESLQIKSAIPHPLIMGVIRECGGKMHLREGNYDSAQTDFFEAFKNYDESGSVRRTTLLKYLVLANMLMKSDINPFDCQETKPYKNNVEIMAMTQLVSAFENKDIKEFEKVLKKNRESILSDLFIREHIDILMKAIRTEVLLQIIKPYTRIYLNHLSIELNIPVRELESLVISCILDKTLHGKIDEVGGVLCLYRESETAENGRYTALERWTNRLSSLHNALNSTL